MYRITLITAATFVFAVMVFAAAPQTVLAFGSDAKLTKNDCIKCHTAIVKQVQEAGNKHKSEVECLECPCRFTGLCSCRSDLRKSYAGADALLIKQDGVIVMADDLKSLLLKVEFIEHAAHQSFLSS